MADRTNSPNTLPMAVEAAEEAAEGVTLTELVETVGPDVRALQDTTGINTFGPEVAVFADIAAGATDRVVRTTVGATVAAVATAGSGVISICAPPVVVMVGLTVAALAEAGEAP